MKSRQKKQIVITTLILLFTLAPWVSVRAEEPWQFLKGFALVPDSPARIEEHYVATLFVNRETRQLAVVVFNTTCDSENCAVNHRAAYSLFDSRGVNIRRYIDPSDQELQMLISDHLAAENHKEGR